MNSRTLCGYLLLLCIVFVVPSVALAEGMSFRELAMQETVTVEGQSINTSQYRLEVKPGAYVRVELFAAGGTGYEWQLLNSDLEMAEVSYKVSEPVKVEKDKTGGPIKTVFIMKVKENARGAELLVFNLVRPWEKQSKENKTFDLTLSIR